MGVSTIQKNGVDVICRCGCETQFKAFPIYSNSRVRRSIESYTIVIGDNGASLYVPKFRRGHHPNCQATNFINLAPWNKGLTGKESRSISRQGRRGNEHWNFDPRMHPDYFSEDFNFKAFAERFGIKPRSKGANKAYASFRFAIMQRDNFTCVDCGMIADENEEQDLLHVHHVVFVKHDRTRIFDQSNVVTLCSRCHRIRHRNKQVAAP